MRKAIKIILGIFAVFIIVGACSSMGDGDKSTKTSETPTTSASAMETTGAPKADAATEPKKETPKADAPKATREQKNALRSAKTYLDSMGGFSEQGLRNQLEFEQFPADAIDYAIANCGADWNEQAVKAAKTYEKTGMGMSDDGLVNQLIVGDNFTPEQAQYGVDHIED